MPRLLVVRGESPVAEVDLDRLPVTVGRGAGNDVVLDDPLKSVSREHAQIRREGDRYVLVDHGSENGIWLAGRRLPVIPFAPDTVVSIGPFRLRIDGLPPEPRRTPVPDGASPRPTPAPSTTRLDAVARARAALSGITPRGWKVVGGVTATIILLIAGVWVGVMLPARDRARIETLSASAVTLAERQIAGGLCADALGQTIQPALVRDPGHVRLQALKQTAEACLAAPPPPPSQRSPVELELTWLGGQLALGICDSQVAARADALLKTEPANAAVVSMKGEVDRCKTAAVVQGAPVGPKLAVRVPPEQGGLDVVDKELDRDYQVRIRAMRQRYDTLVAAATAAVNREAVQALDALARDVPAGYLELDATLTAARAALAAATERLLTEGRELTAQSRWNDALTKFAEAKALDPQVRTDADVKRVQDGRIRQGEELCGRARRLANFTATLPEAQALFRQVMELVPPQHQCYADALRWVNKQ